MADSKSSYILTNVEQSIILHFSRSQTYPQKNYMQPIKFSLFTTASNLCGWVNQEINFNFVWGKLLIIEKVM
ncbi:hypothetical protein [Calothrix sp. UHCC 0171]|uniref:hypothetical protein n=1 Tax=Calothrix sp. UHCC 0171 TaxID=3110245 RepID=UPI002B219F54|nr:hypothetical protein [Calothrix sp. UHCC 0171]MEA5573768.1 hypothetical protein [Calothrix sp. UHCC 0171]